MRGFEKNAVVAADGVVTADASAAAAASIESAIFGGLVSILEAADIPGTLLLLLKRWTLDLTLLHSGLVGETSRKKHPF